MAREEMGILGRLWREFLVYLIMRGSVSSCAVKVDFVFLGQIMCVAVERIRGRCEVLKRWGVLGSFSSHDLGIALG